MTSTKRATDVSDRTTRARKRQRTDEAAKKTGKSEEGSNLLPEERVPSPSIVFEQVTAPAFVEKHKIDLPGADILYQADVRPSS